MNVWRFRGFSKDYTGFVHLDKQDAIDGTFEADGTTKNWTALPKLEPFVEKNKKKQKPVGDVSYILPGSVIFNKKAYEVLKSFLLPFGEFLEVECLNTGELLGEGAQSREIRYFYNVTNIIACIDYENSEKIGSGVSKPVFFPEATPNDIQVFKDPLHKYVEIYLSGPAKTCLEQLIVDAQLTGAVFEQVA